MGVTLYRRALYTAEKPHALNISTIGKENSFGEYGDAFDEWTI